MSITLSMSMSASLSIASTAKFDNISWPIRDRRYDLILLRDEKERSQDAVVTGIISAGCSNFNNSVTATLIGIKNCTRLVILCSSILSDSLAFEIAAFATGSSFSSLHKSRLYCSIRGFRVTKSKKLQ